MFEVDGPPMAYFEIPLSYFVNSQGDLEHSNYPGAVRLVERITYRTFVRYADNAQSAHDQLHHTYDAILAELAALHKHQDGMFVIWWRLRPTVAEAPEMPKEQRYRARMRLATSPDLPPPFWQRIGAVDQNLGIRIDGSSRA